MGYKSRSCYANPGVCFKGDCIHHETKKCKDCIRFDLYKKKGIRNGNIEQIKCKRH
jgi:hypothetical protein